MFKTFNKGKIPAGYVLPGEDTDETFEEVTPVLRCRINPYKIDLLNQGLLWGCEWAEEERKKIGI